MIQNNISLQSYNTFGIEAKAKQFVEINKEFEIIELFDAQKLKQPMLILGGGSNLLLTKDYEGLAIKLNLKGIQVLEETENEVIIKVAAGEVWHEFVLWCLNQNYGGIENLSLIPGSVGAAPMQNIGAYGVELESVFESLTAFELETGDFVEFTKDECKFSYRESIFKNTHKNQYLITSVVFRLLKTNHKINDTYGAIQSEFEKLGIANPTIQDISKAVINIRQSKLPDPKEIGNSGSFFKNPIVEFSVFERIKKEYENVPNYPTESGKIKLAAGWLIDQCGWKGKRIVNCGVHKKQALVLVNYGGATGQEIFDLSEQILQDVKAKFGVQLVREVNVIK